MSIPRPATVPFTPLVPPRLPISASLLTTHSQAQPLYHQSHPPISVAQLTFVQTHTQSVPFRLDGPPPQQPTVSASGLVFSGGPLPSITQVSVLTQPVPIQVKDAPPDVPYFDLPAGLMVPLVALSDCDYKPVDPSKIRLPPPTPPSEKLLKGVDSFYAPPSHDRPRNNDGWEQLGLYEFFREKEKFIKELKNTEATKKSASKEKRRSVSPSSPRRRYREDRSPKRRSRRSSSSSRSRSRSRSSSKGRSKSRSRTPPSRRRRRRSTRSRSRTPPTRSTNKSKFRPRSRSASPDGFV